MRNYQTPSFAYGHSTSLAPTPLERLRGRLMRASAPPAFGGGGGMVATPPQQTGGQGGQQGSGESQQQGNNGGGNSTGGDQSGGNQNNGGQAFDASSFWSEPSSSEGSPPASRGSDGQQSGGGGQQSGGDDNANFGRELGQRMSGLDYGSFMTPEIAGHIAEGNFESFNTAMTNQNRRLMQDTMTNAISVMQRFGDQIMGEVDRRMGAQFGNRENQQALVSEIPLAADPTMAPVVQSVFQQAMKHHRNDRPKALAMTKDMLKHVHNSMQSEGSGLGIPPATPNNNGGGVPATNWLEELAGRPG